MSGLSMVFRTDGNMLKMRIEHCIAQMSIVNLSIVALSHSVSEIYQFYIEEVVALVQIYDKLW